jgi:drug/metabolite transporter, DME family
VQEGVDTVQHTPTAEAHRVGLALIACAAVLWGTVGVSTQALYTTSAATPLSVGFFRLALAAPPLILACALALGARAWRLARRDWLLAVVIGLLLAAYQACYFTAIAFAGVAVATLITLCTAPVLAALLGVLLLGERVAPVVLLALGGALIGTALLVGQGPAGLAPRDQLTGALFALGSAFGYAAVTVCGRLLSPQAHPLQVNAIAFPAGALLLLGLALPQGLVVSYSPVGWALLLYLGLAPTALAYGLFLAGVRRVGVTAATLVTLLEPLTATVLAWLLLGERFAPLGLLGAALLVAALALLARSAPGRA